MEGARGVTQESFNFQQDQNRSDVLSSSNHFNRPPERNPQFSWKDRFVKNLITDMKESLKIPFTTFVGAGVGMLACRVLGGMFNVHSPFPLQLGLCLGGAVGLLYRPLLLKNIKAEERLGFLKGVFLLYASVSTSSKILQQVSIKSMNFMDLSNSTSSIDLLMHEIAQELILRNMIAAGYSIIASVGSIGLEINNWAFQV